MVMLHDRKLAPASLGRVLVLGLGKSGKASVEYCLQLLGPRVECLAIAAGARNEAAEQFADYAKARGAYVAFGDEAVGLLDGRVKGEEEGPAFDLCIASPGISEFSDLYASAVSVSREVVSEVEFAWRESAADSRWVAITGTNGKTTATSLTAHVLKECGLRAAAVGNIGDTCIEAVASGDVDVYVAEVSSYQMASTRDFAPNVAVMLNITPDHVKWHCTLEAYRDAKFKVFDNLRNTPGAVAVLDATNDVVRAKVREFRGMSREDRGFEYVPVGAKDGLSADMRACCGSDNAAFVNADGCLQVALSGKDEVLLPAEKLQIKGEHNANNALAAASAALALGVDADRLSAALQSFAPLEHRIEPCGFVGDVECFNDSKATNVDAVMKALEAFPSNTPLILLGGDDKGTDLTDLVASTHRHARVAVCFGAAGDRFYAAFEKFSDRAPDGFLLLRADHLEDALDAALDVSRKGDVVLLSPACASFDEFNSFEHRGVMFKNYVAQRADALKE